MAGARITSAPLSKRIKPSLLKRYVDESTHTVFHKRVHGVPSPVEVAEPGPTLQMEAGNGVRIWKARFIGFLESRAMRSAGGTRTVRYPCDPPPKLPEQLAWRQRRSRGTTGSRGPLVHVIVGRRRLTSASRSICKPAAKPSQVAIRVFCSRLAQQYRDLTAAVGRGQIPPLSGRPDPNLAAYGPSEALEVTRAGGFGLSIRCGSESALVDLQIVANRRKSRFDRWTSCP